jgi:hypothetical protein
VADAFETIAAIIDAAQPAETAEQILGELAASANAAKPHKDKKSAAPGGRPSDPADLQAPKKTALRVISGGLGESGNESTKNDLTAADSLSRSRIDEPENEPQEPGPKTFGFDLEKLNQEFALVLMGSRAVVFHEQPDAMIEDQKRILSLEGFHNWLANRLTQVRGSDGKIKTISWSKRWLTSKERRSYSGIEFHPNPDGAAGMKGYLNLWSGFAVEAAAEPDARRYKTFRDHLLVNICSGREDRFKWLFGFFANIVQRPRERPGTALVMRGRMGTGKTIVGEIIGRLFPRHYFLVDDPRYVTGQFNAHMATCLLLQADEAVWAGDKAAEGRLKGLVTSRIQQIEAKGHDPIRLKNYVRLIMTSNEEWVVPAGKDERRFAVLDVDPRCAQQHAYFREMDDELAAGGLEHLLADLIRFDLSSVNVWQIPKTDALLEQKIRSLASVESWWFGRLMSGTTTSHAREWRREIPCHMLFADYTGVSDKIGIKRKSEETVVGMMLNKLVAGLDRKKRWVDVTHDQSGQTTRERVWCYLLPPLAEARQMFADSLGQKVAWPLDLGEEDDEHESQPEVHF